MEIESESDRHGKSEFGTQKVGKENMVQLDGYNVENIRFLTWIQVRQPYSKYLKRWMLMYDQDVAEQTLLPESLGTHCLSRLQWYMVERACRCVSMTKDILWAEGVAEITMDSNQSDSRCGQLMLNRKVG